jgi:hypothetical protein
MSILKEFRKTEDALNEKLTLLQALQQNAALPQELEFEKKLSALMKRYSKRIEDIRLMVEHPATLADIRVNEHAPTYKASKVKKETKARK